MPKPPKGTSGPLAKIAVPKDVSPEQREALLAVLKDRFEGNMHRHPGLEWRAVAANLQAAPEKVVSLFAMESTGGEPDVIGYDAAAGQYLFVDCSPESPAGRRSVCYDRAGEQARERQGVYPAGNAVDLAAAMGIELLTEEQYLALQALGDFDTKTESWLRAPPEIRKLGGGIFGDRRYGRVFVFHNSAPSFYAARGFRGLLRV